MRAEQDAKALALVSRERPRFVVDYARLKADCVPVLAVVGTRNPVRPDVDALDGLLSNLTITRLEGTGHPDAVTHPVFRKTVTTFLAARR